jgi:inhibitor of KinA
MRWEPLADQAVMVYCDDEKQASILAEHVRRLDPTWLVDVVQAYVSVAVFYDASSDYFQAADWLQCQLPLELSKLDVPAGRSHLVPCCYEFGLDIDRISEHTGLSREQIITQHSQTVYTVYAIGFCPGFPYLGYLPAVLTGVPRLSTPRLHVEVGSVGLTGRQTGIYTERRPGGWNIVGKTPLQMVDVQEGYFPLRTGDEVRYQRIDESAFRELHGERLTNKMASGGRKPADS